MALWYDPSQPLFKDDMISYNGTTPRIVINELFGSVVFDYIETVRGYHKYGAHLHSGMVRDQQYVFLIIYADQLYPQRIYCHNVDWVNFQTRYMQNCPYNLEPQRWVRGKITSDISFELVNRSYEETTYGCGECISSIMKLLHVKKRNKKPSIYQWRDRYSLSAACETFQMVLTVPPTKTDEMEVIML